MERKSRPIAVSISTQAPAESADTSLSGYESGPTAIFAHRCCNECYNFGMRTQSFTLFDTAIGRCGIAWSGPEVAGVHLPERREIDTYARLRRRFPGAREALPPPEVQRAVDGIVALLSGEPSDLSRIALDMRRVPLFDRLVYEVARTIPPGETLSYGEVASRLGDRSLARDVGQALGRNPFAIIVPCHRVMAAGGKVGGFSANGGVATKLRLLAIEGAPANGILPLFGADSAFGGY
jgi:O-6-methylguanine DNA methyltransferase